MRNAYWLVLGTLTLAVGAAATAGSLATAASPGGRREVHHATSAHAGLGDAPDLTPDLAIVHYRERLAPVQDLEALISELEARAAAPTASQYDLTDLAELYFKRAQQDGNLADYAKSEVLAEQSLAILPDPNGANLLLAKLAGARHDFPAAIAIARQQLAKKSAAGAFGILATDYLALGELTAAAAAADSMVAKVPSSGSYLTRALVEQAQGRDAEAAFDFQRAAAVEVYGDVLESARTRALWGRFLLRRGEATAAALVIDEALRIAPGNPLALAQRGELLLRAGQPQAAASAFEEAFASSRQVRYLMDLSRAQGVAGDAAGARDTRAHAEAMIRTELADRGLGHRLDLVELLVDDGTTASLQEAITLGQAELVQRPSADVRYQLGRALATAGFRTDAATQARAILASGVRDARFYALAARVETGPRAAFYARQARSLDRAAAAAISPWLAHELPTVVGGPRG